MTKKYILSPGTIQSKSDGQYHFIGARQLADLYRVPMEECIVIEGQWPRGYRPSELKSLPVLRPKYDGDYSLPS